MDFQVGSTLLAPDKEHRLFTGSDFFRVSFLISKLNPHPFFAGEACVRSSILSCNSALVLKQN